MLAVFPAAFISKLLICSKRELSWQCEKNSMCFRKSQEKYEFLMDMEALSRFPFKSLQKCLKKS